MKKKLGILVVLCIMLLCFSTIVLADSFTLTATPDKSSLKPGDEVEITLKISDINAGTNGINALEAKLQYDESVFEKVSQDDVSSKNNWSLTYNDENTIQKGKMLAMILSAGVKNDQEIGGVKLRVKDDLTSTTLTKQTEVKLVNVSTNNGTAIINEVDKNIPLTLQFDKVVEASEVKQVDINNQEPQVNENKTNDKTVAEGSVPQTGTNEVILLFIVGTISVIGIYTYVRYKKIIIK
ncbi:MAG: hypothetical protein J6M60_02470 [Clostridia bacterium]|nr:hypothetical protein [Clostridia bacterium]